MSWKIEHGDCLDLLKAIPSNSFDSIVSDPPAGIGFCGKDWDSDKGGRDQWVEWLTQVMREALRVLKPGGHAAIWAFPRTSHWTAWAVENAGFEIVNVIHHLYAQGFAKGLNVSKAFDKMRQDDCRPVCRFLREAMERQGVRLRDIAAHFNFHPRMVEHWAARDTDSQPSLPTLAQWQELKRLLVLDDTMDAEVIRLNERKGTPGDDFAKREVVARGTAGMAQFGDTWGTPAGYEKEYDVTSPYGAAAKEWEGWNTALKPAAEHWILAKKPVSERNIPLNLLKWGTGGLNIGACRVNRAADDVPGWHKSGADGSKGYQGEDTFAIRAMSPEEIQARCSGGRWPANLLLSHSAGCRSVGSKTVSGDRRAPQGGSRPGGFVNTGSGSGDGKPCGPLYGDETLERWECVEGCPVAELDKQSGVRKSPAPGVSRREPPISASRENTLHTGGYVGFTGYGDTGTASRYFTTLQPALFKFQAKPARREKELGCEGLPDRVLNRVNSGGLENEARFAPVAVKNNHPTVKSIALARWLCRLVCRPGGTVLDMFAGSGSIGCGALLEGFNFVGIEADEASAEIARARLTYWEAEAGGQQSLFTEEEL